MGSLSCLSSESGQSTASSVTTAGEPGPIPLLQPVGTVVAKVLDSCVDPCRPSAWTLLHSHVRASSAWN